MPDQTTLPAGSAPASALDGQPVTQFGQFKFPCAFHDLDGEQRDYIHEWPHRDAGAPEKLGRQLYKCSVRGLFHANFKQFPDLYPGTINSLQDMFEAGTTDLLVHPSAGTFPAYIKQWKRRRDPKVRSGEVVDILFQEDQQTAFLASDIATTSPGASLASSASALSAQLAAVQKSNALALSLPTMSIFGAIQTVSNSIAGIADTVNMYGNLVGAKAQELVNLCNQADAALDIQDARGYSIVDALHNLWYQAASIVNDVQAQQVSLQTWTVPTTMPLTAISTRLYGDATHTDDLLALNANAIPDPLAVKGGTALQYYPAS